MVENELVKYYKNHVTGYNLILKYCKGYYYFSITLMYLIIFSSLFLSVSLFANKYKMLSFSMAISNVILLFLGVLLLNEKIKKILKNKYKINSKKFFWDPESIELMQLNLITSYLEKHELYENDKLEFLIATLKEKSRERKIPKFFQPGLLAALLLPIWIQFVRISFGSIKRIEGFAGVALGILVISIVLVPFIQLVKTVTRDVTAEFFNKEVQIIDRLIKRLEDVYLLYRSGEIKKTS